jgi:molybdopterin converting factor small subunit
VKVIAHLHTTLQKETPEGFVRVLPAELGTEARVVDLINQLELVVDEENTLFVIRGQIVEKEKRLSEGDEVHFIPAISGGRICDKADKYTL